MPGLNRDSVVSILLEGLGMIYSVLKALFVSFLEFFISPSEKSVEGEIVLVTGSGGAIGRGLSIKFSELGAIVILWDIDEDANKETAEIIRSKGGTCHPFTIDVGDHEAVFKTSQIITRDIGEVDYVINNAAVVIGRRLLDCPDDEIRKTFKVNLLAQFWTVKCFLPSMLRRNHGHIVNIASSTGLVGLKNLTDYSSSKYGVVGFSEVLYYELVFSGHTGVHTTLVCPAFVKSKMFDGCKYRFPKLLQPLEVDECVEKIVHAVRTNQIVICIPRMVYFFSILKTILPVCAMNALIKFLGAADFMNTFIGRKDRDKKDLHDVTDTDADVNGMNGLLETGGSTHVDGGMPGKKRQ